MAEEQFDVIVVGAGFGGAACAGLLAKRGLEVLLLEKNAKAGGKAMAFSKGGFVYTPWVVITAPIQDNAFERVLKELEQDRRHRFLENTVREMEWWACFQPPKQPPGQRPVASKKSKVGRNDPCPCGSGKKYKRCCLRKERS